MKHQKPTTASHLPMISIAITLNVPHRRQFRELARLIQCRIESRVGIKLPHPGTRELRLHRPSEPRHPRVEVLHQCGHAAGILGVLTHVDHARYALQGRHVDQEEVGRAGPGPQGLQEREVALEDAREGLVRAAAGGGGVRAVALVKGLADVVDAEPERVQRRRRAVGDVAGVTTRGEEAVHLLGEGAARRGGDDALVDRRAADCHVVEEHGCLVVLGSEVLWPFETVGFEHAHVAKGVAGRGLHAFGVEERTRV